MEAETVIQNNNVYVGFDFSINKPAATVFYNGRVWFYFWAIDLSEKKLEAYHTCGVRAMSRNLKSIKTSETENSQLVLLHTIRSTDLANLIISNLDCLIHEELSLEDFNLYVCSEGLSYDSKGDAALNLATYKGVLLSKIYEHYGDSLVRLFTYAPITLKATAGCATKELRKDKANMIKAFITKSGIDSPFIDALQDGTLILKKNYMEGVDDIVDSFWALKTMFVKEKIKY